jgi:hypothetical protein
MAKCFAFFSTGLQTFTFHAPVTVNSCSKSGHVEFAAGSLIAAPGAAKQSTDVTWSKRASYTIFLSHSLMNQSHSVTW